MRDGGVDGYSLACVNKLFINVLYLELNEWQMVFSMVENEWEFEPSQKLPAAVCAVGELSP